MSEPYASHQVNLKTWEKCTSGLSQKQRRTLVPGVWHDFGGNFGLSFFFVFKEKIDGNVFI
jgi:hypothetical protein